MLWEIAKGVIRKSCSAGRCLIEPERTNGPTSVRTVADAPVGRVGEDTSRS